MDLKEFKSRFQKLKSKGFIRSLRQGSTGIGYTFETLLGLQENNLALPDISKIEIKTHRDDANSMITLFTFNKKAWQIKPLDAIRKYGSRDDNNRLGLYYTMSRTPNAAGLFLTVDNKKIAIQHTSGELIATWDIINLLERFKQKIPALLLISVHTEKRGDAEYFHFYRAQLMSDSSLESLAEALKTESVLVDLRLHDKKMYARNHGTGFRIYKDKLPSLFKKIEDI